MIIMMHTPLNGKGTESILFNCDFTQTFFCWPKSSVYFVTLGVLLLKNKQNNKTKGGGGGEQKKRELVFLYQALNQKVSWVLAALVAAYSISKLYK